MYSTGMCCVVQVQYGLVEKTVIFSVLVLSDL